MNMILHGAYAGFVSYIEGKFFADALCYPIAIKKNIKIN